MWSDRLEDARDCTVRDSDCTVGDADGLVDGTMLGDTDGGPWVGGDEGIEEGGALGLVVGDPTGMPSPETRKFMVLAESEIS